MMDDILDIIKMMAEGGYTWQETIIMSLALVGLTLSVMIVVRGGVSLVGLVMKTVERAIDKIHIPEKTKAEKNDG